MGEYGPDSGDVKIGSNVNIGYLAQDVVFEESKRTVLDTFRDGMTIHEGPARTILAKFLFFKDDVFKKISNLSGGELSRLKLCQLMQQKINLLI